MKPMKWNSFLIRDEIFLLILLKMYLLCEKLLCFFFFWIFDLLNFSFINLAKEQQLHESIESKLVIACKHMKRLARENVFSFDENNSFIKWNIKRCTFNLDFLVLSSNNFYTNIHMYIYIKVVLKIRYKWRFVWKISFLSKLVRLL